MNSAPALRELVRQPGQAGPTAPRAPFFAAARTALPTAVVLAACGLVPLLGAGQYLLYLASLAIAYAIVAIGLNITNGYLGLVNLAVGGQIALGAYGCVIALLHGAPLPLALALAVILGAAASALIFAAFAQLHDFFFGLATLAAAEVIRLLVRNLDGVTNGVRGLRGYPGLAASPQATYWVLLGTLALLVFATWLVARSSLGLRWRAVRENRTKAAALGIPVLRLQFLGYVLSGAIMSLGGAFIALLLQYIEPGIADLKILVQAVLMVALGGPSTVLGPVVGAVIITLVPELLRVTNELRLVIYGLALMLVVLALPGGVFGFAERMRRQRAMARRETRDERSER